MSDEKTTTPSNILDRLTEGLIGILDRIMGTVENATANIPIVNVVIPLLRQIVNFLAPMLQSLMKALLGFLQSIFGSLFGSVFAKMGSAGGMLGGIIRGISDELLPAVSSLIANRDPSKIIRLISDTVWGALSTVSIRGILSVIFENTAKMVGSSMPKVLQLLEYLLSIFDREIQKLTEIVEPIMRTLIGPLIEFVSPMMKPLLPLSMKPMYPFIEKMKIIE